MRVCFRRPRNDSALHPQHRLRAPESEEVRMNTKAQNLRAKRKLAHAIRYLAASAEEEANDVLRRAIVEVYRDHLRFSRAIVRHRCIRCIQYRDAGASRKVKRYA
jgi:hypothetical protein